MEPGSDIEPVVDKIRRGEISVLDAFAAELPDVFAAEILPKLAAQDTLRLAQVNKLCRDTVWSEDNVRSLGAKFQETIPTIDGGTISRFESSFGHPIHWAAAHRVLPAVRALLKSEEEAYNRVTNGGLTALHYAVGRRFRNGLQSPPYNLKIVRMLIEAGADINKLTNCGKTPMRYAATRGHPKATKILINAGADLNISSPLRKAVQAVKNNSHLPNYCRRCQACADLLIQAGATIPDDLYYDSGSYDSEFDSDPDGIF
tara:strand:- start:49 stop:825 length:777 start_codon:yes stop_codon:yes gene_type:complete